MEKLIEFLRSLDFFFATMTEEIDAVQLHKKYVWMIRHKRRNPDSLDLSIMVGIKMWGKKNDKVLVYHKGAWFRTLHVPWKDKADINFRKITVRLKFPDYLNYDERRKWRAQHHQQLKDPTRTPTEWYKKILPDVQFI